VYRCPIRSVLPLAFVALLLGGVLVLGGRALDGWHGPARVGGTGVVLVYALWCVVEAATSFRDVSVRVRGEHWSTEAYALAQGGTALAALGFSPRAAPDLAWLGFAALVFLGGVGLRLASVRTLGRFYSHRVRVTAGHALVTAGPYAVLRHPAYTGMLVAHAGFVACFASLPAACALVLLVSMVLVRVRIEERVLTAEIPGYEEFCRTRRRLVPFVW
jgi:protein-S-isoprenylcysteine O-methyltransferase Ste14